MADFYGQSRNLEVEQKVAQELKNYLNKYGVNLDGKYWSNYVNAVAYGGYSYDDAVKDISNRQSGKDGVIHPTYNRKTYLGSDTNRGWLDSVLDQIKPEQYEADEEELKNKFQEEFGPEFEKVLAEIDKQANERKKRFGEDTETALRRAAEDYGYKIEELAHAEKYLIGDRDTALQRLGTQRGWLNEDYDLAKQREQFEWDSKVRDYEVSAQKRNISETLQGETGGVYKFGQQQMEQARQFGQTEMDRNYQRSGQQYDWQEEGINKSFEKGMGDIATQRKSLNTSYDRTKEDVATATGREEYDVDDWLKKRQEEIERERQESLGGYLEDRKYDQFYT